MPKFAEYDPSTSMPHPVIGWYDTDALEYPNMPDQSRLTQMTDDEWENRMSRPKGVSGSGAIIDLPVPTVIEIVKTYKTDIWERCTEEEAATLDAELQQLSVKLRRMWDDSNAIYSNSPSYPILRAAMVQQFGEDRTAVILAPSVE